MARVKRPKSVRTKRTLYLPGNVKQALYHLGMARALLQVTEAWTAAEKVRRAITSAQGALRHAKRMEYAPGIRLINAARAVLESRR